jgi:glycosyltransferase involved in cell wall biosynthesis
MRILLVGPAESVHVTRWARFLAGRLHDVTIFSEQLPLEPIERVKVRLAPLQRLPRPVRLIVAAIVARVVQIVLKPEVVHIHSVGSNSLMTALLRPRKLIVSPWGSDILRPSSALHRMLAVRTLRRASLILTTSTQMAEEIAAIIEPTPARIQVISWGVDSRVFGPSPVAARVAARLRWALPSNGTVLISVRASTEVYRVEQVVDAFSIAASRRSDLHLVLLAGSTSIGRPSTGRTQEYRQRVWSRARSMPERITIVDQYLSDHDVASLLASADAAISIPAWDQRSTSVLEALACGLRVIATDIPPYRELQSNGYRMDLIREPIVGNLAEVMTRVGPDDERARAGTSSTFRAAEDRSTQFARMEAALASVANGHPLA